MAPGAPRKERASETLMACRGRAAPTTMPTTTAKRARDDALAALDVIFLDVDGVLLPFGAPSSTPDATNTLLRSALPPPKQLEGTQFHLAPLAALSKIVAATGATLVLSSTWRAVPAAVEELLAAFQASGLPGISTLQRFEHMTARNNHSERQWEIGSWLNTHRGSVRAWCAIDDEELLEGRACARHREEFEGHVVKTESCVGLTEELAEEAIAILRRGQRQQDET